MSHCIVGSIFQSYYGGIAGESSSNDREPHVYFMGIIDILQVHHINDISIAYLST